MFCRASRLLLVVFEAMWLNVIVPGHTRGIITLPGAPTSFEAPCCCCCEQPDKSDPHSKAQPSQNKRAAYCAICAFSARLSPPPAIDFILPPMVLLKLAPPPVVEGQRVAPVLATYDGRAPPAA